MRSLNRCQFVGNLGADPEIRYTASGDAVANLRIACSDKWRDKNTGETKERTEWVSLVAWRALAEIIEKYLHKGDKIYAEGSWQTRKWQDQSGNDRYTTEVVLSDLIMMGGNQGAQGQGSAPQGATQAAQARPDLDQDIPF